MSEKSDLVFISSQGQLNRSFLHEKREKFFNCLYCKEDIKAHLLSETKCYYYYKNCKCQYIGKDDILIKLEIDTEINEKSYTVQLDLMKNKTNLICGRIIYSYDECLAISPTNIRNKVLTWLMML
jgi:hypothetical protein